VARWLTAAGLPAAALTAGAADKSGYSWTKPVPSEWLREMTTDQPDSTESPYTVDPGHVQLEMDFATLTRDRQNGVRATEWGVAPFNLRLGLTADFETGVFLAPYQQVTVKTPAGGRERHAGFGDITLRAKWNVTGNDSDGFAWGLMADLKLPTAAAGLGNDKVEGALALPMAFALPAGWDGGAMTAVELVHTEIGRRRAVWVNTLAVGRDLSANVAGFLELTSATGDGRHVATFNFGLTRRFGANVQLDSGVNLGLTQAAADQTYFAGITRRY
jgi:hypothetical protein